VTAPKRFTPVLVRVQGVDLDDMAARVKRYSCRNCRMYEPARGCVIESYADCRANHPLGMRPRLFDEKDPPAPRTISPRWFPK
jgi:hypothetical protein